MSENKETITALNPGIFQIRGLNGSSHSYVIKGSEFVQVKSSGR